MKLKIILTFFIGSYLYFTSYFSPDYILTMLGGTPSYTVSFDQSYSARAQKMLSQQLAAQPISYKNSKHLCNVNASDLVEHIVHRRSFPNSDNFHITSPSLCARINNEFLLDDKAIIHDVTFFADEVVAQLPDVRIGDDAKSEEVFIRCRDFIQRLPYEFRSQCSINYLDFYTIVLQPQNDLWHYFVMLDPTTYDSGHAQQYLAVVEKVVGTACQKVDLRFDQRMYVQGGKGNG